MERARSFLERAEDALEEDVYDVAVFLADIAVQLYLKSVLMKLVGDYPRPHSTRLLLAEISKHMKTGEISEFVKAHRARITALEDAYMAARYSVRPFEREDAEDAVRLGDDGADRAMSYMDIMGERARMIREWRSYAVRLAEAVGKALPGAEVYIFGSVIRGEAVEASDVNVLVMSAACQDRTLRGLG